MKKIFGIKFIEQKDIDDAVAGLKKQLEEQHEEHAKALKTRDDLYRDVVQHIIRYLPVKRGDVFAKYHGDKLAKLK